MRLFFIVSFFLCLSLFAHAETKNQTLTDTEKKVLTVFLKTLFEDTETGYAFFNEKPVCTCGYSLKDSLLITESHHKTDVALKEGVSLFKKIDTTSSDIFLLFSKENEPSLSRYGYILAINKPLFLSVVNENLSLFQYVLGPDVTSEKLLHAILQEHQPFQSLLKHDKVLIGILLGFGLENSLAVSRLENIHEALGKERPPFLTQLAQKVTDLEYLPIQPSFGYQSVLTESENTKKIEMSSVKLATEKPPFFMGIIKDLDSNKELIQKLEAAQKKVQDLISSKDYENFALETLKMTPCCTGDVAKKSTSNMDNIIARGIWETLKNYDSAYLDFFVEGMKNPDMEKLKIDRSAYDPNYLAEIREAKENLLQANGLFQSLNIDKKYSCISPFKLYYRVLETDKNAIKKPQGSLVKITYSIYSPLGHCLGKGSNEIVNLNNTVSGFAHGLQGMKINETREIVIHPTLAYGFTTRHLDKCLYLKAVVTLHDVLNEEPLFEMSPTDLDYVFDENVMKLREEAYKNVLREKGAKLASHLRKSQEITLAKIIGHLTEFSQSNKEYVPTTEIEQELINKIHWNIYFEHFEG